MIIYDHRQDGEVQHELLDVLFIAVTATICGCDEWPKQIIVIPEFISYDNFPASI